MTWVQCTWEEASRARDYGFPTRNEWGRRWDTGQPGVTWFIPVWFTALAPLPVKYMSEMGLDTQLHEQLNTVWALSPSNPGRACFDVIRDWFFTRYENEGAQEAPSRHHVLFGPTKTRQTDLMVGLNKVAEVLEGWDTGLRTPARCRSYARAGTCRSCRAVRWAQAPAPPSQRAGQAQPACSPPRGWCWQTPPFPQTCHPAPHPGNRPGRHSACTAASPSAPLALGVPCSCAVPCAGSERKHAKAPFRGCNPVGAH